MTCRQEAPRREPRITQVPYEVGPLLAPEELPRGWRYPGPFVRFFKRGLTDLDPWLVLSGDYLRRRYAGLRDRHPSRRLIPFAMRQDREDIACWDADVPRAVFQFEDFQRPPSSPKPRYENFYAWLRQAIEDLIEFDMHDFIPDGSEEP